MSHPGPGAPVRSTRTRTIAIADVVAVVLVIAVVVGALRSGASRDAGTAAGATPSPSSSTTVEPAPSPSDDAVASPAPEPSAGGAAAGTADPETPAEAPAPAAPAFGEPVPTQVEAPVDVAEGVAVTVSGLEAVDGDGVGPGEIDGPAVRFTVSVANRTADEVSLASAAVNAYFGASLTPGIQLSGSGARALPATVPAGGTVDGVYVFLLPDDRSPTRVEVFSVPQASVVVAEAPTPGG